jgi:MFS family permease
MTYGILQEYYLDNWSFHGNSSTAGVIGPVSNGVMYLSMPLLFAAFSRRWVSFRRATALCGIVVACISFLISSFSTDVSHLITTQGVLAALGCALLYTPTTLSLGEYFSSKNRAVAYGVVLSCKNITGSVCPFLLQYLLDHYGFRTTMRIWTAIVGGTSLLAIFIMPIHPPWLSSATAYRPRRTPWEFLHHRTFYIYSVAIILQSSGYGLPQTYLNSYAHSITSFSASSSTLLITLFNAPGIISSAFFGLLSDNKRMPLSATSTSFISALTSALAAFFLWGLASASSHSTALLVLFAMIYGFFAGGYSATWGGVVKEMEKEAAEKNEAIDTGLVYGLLNGARGIGYVGGGLVGVQLLKAGSEVVIGKFGYGTEYGPLILYTGLATSLGGWSIAFKGKEVLRRIRTLDILRRD